ncbi:DUF4331 family protein [Vibrio sp. Sgm 5]|uniref:DUF4331 family protein n=1 Tax=Vibrio sp. Sgm 5 TaxID=2994387 RepID=UPI0022495DB9|nr:DUF4331 family protein [Vibrio sp. Sgm 5]MCX2789533.1 DUF4331 family protein [Vibrio sp. Sgm 5]
MLKLSNSLLLLTMLSASAQASHHFESSLAQNYPKLDVTDTYVFPSSNGESTVFAMSFNPNSESNTIDNFSENGVYGIHIKDQLKHITYLFSKKDGFIEVRRTDNYKSTNPINQSEFIGKVRPSTTGVLFGDIKIWSGAIKDPFFADGDGFRKFRKDIEEGRFNLKHFTGESEFFQNRTSTGIVIEIPNEKLESDVSVFSTSSFYSGEHWHQVNYSANVLLTNLYLFDNKVKVIKNTNLLEKNDIVKNEIIKNIEIATSASNIKNNKSYSNKVSNLLIPDYIRYKVGTKAEYDIMDPNGRDIRDDAFDNSLSVFTGQDVSDGNDKQLNYQDYFPYFIPAN